MARLPLPERGQPLDVSYIYSMAEVINQVATTVSTATYNYVSIDTPSAGKQNAKITDTRMIGGYLEIVSGTNVDIGNERAFSYDFPADFKYAPIVTATAINLDGNPAGNAVIVTLKSITTSRITGTVRFNVKGTASVGLNLIIIGIPN